MKKLSLFTVALTFLSLTAFAADPVTPPAGCERVLASAQEGPKVDAPDAPAEAPAAPTAQPAQ